MVSLHPKFPRVGMLETGKHHDDQDLFAFVSNRDTSTTNEDIYINFLTGGLLPGRSDIF